MDENKANLVFEKNEYIFKILYLIRKNLPTSEFLYLLMFFLKYIGLILFSISLNTYNSSSNSNTRKNISLMSDRPEDKFGFSDKMFSSDIPFGEREKEPSDINNNDYNSSTGSNNSNNNMVVVIFKKLLINGDNFKILNDS